LSDKNKIKTKNKSKSAASDSSAGGHATPASDSPMDVRLIEQFVKLMQANDLTTVEVCEGDKRITLKRGGSDMVGHAPMAASMPAHAHAPRAHAVPATAPTAPAEEAEDAGLVAIKSPMVGTFYAKASPDAKPFVSVGSTVDEETDVCVIEAMKVFNNIKAETRGTIAKIMVSDGQSVEFGTVLFLVKP
jgi:acetyl-CoA carboxylase biotin carboxyl carrier protein